MLGELPGFFPVGELRGIWHALETDELCGCGSRFADCSFWHAVGDRAFGGWQRVDSRRMLELDAGLARHRHVGRLALPILRGRHARQLDEYTRVLRSLYGAVSEESQCAVIVDSTKDPPYAFLLRSVREIDLRVAHLIRDSRGVAYSWAKRGVARPEYANHPLLRGTFMNRRTPWRSAVLWDLKNLLFHCLASSGVPRVLIRYESLVEDPGTNIRRVMSLVGVGDATTIARDAYAASGDSYADLTSDYNSLPHHTLGGNRIRFVRGKVSLHNDDEWRSSMRHWPRIVVGALTLPLLIAYGYIGRTSAS
jgi:hypothetical protein